MISSNAVKIILVISLALVLGSACRFFGGETKTNPDSPVAEVQTNVPFETQEPETFQAEIVVSNYINGKKTKRRYFVAKKGIKNLIIFDYGTDNEKANLQTDEATSYLIDRKQKTLMKRTRTETTAGSNELKNFLTTKWLNEKVDAKFEDLGAADNLARYRVTLAESEKTEVIIFFDEKLKIPVKQEFSSIVGDERMLNYSVEVKDVKTEVNDEVFAIPADYLEESPESEK